MVTPNARGVLPYIGYIGMCSLKESGFSALLVTEYGLCTPAFDMGMFLGSHLFIIIKKKINKSPSQIHLTLL